MLLPRRCCRWIKNVAATTLLPLDKTIAVPQTVPPVSAAVAPASPCTTPFNKPPRQHPPRYIPQSVH
eukprot:356541-Chlamydomonas_euryale.AAC.5